MTREKLNLDFDAQELADRFDAPVEEVLRNEQILGFVKAVAEEIRITREKAGLTQRGLAELLGVSPGRVSQYETGMLRHAPNLRTIAEIASVLGCAPMVRFVETTSEPAVPVDEDAPGEEPELAAFVAGSESAEPAWGDISIGEAVAMIDREMAELALSKARSLISEHPEAVSEPLFSERLRRAAKSA